MQILLASSSPRRRQLMQEAGYDFVVIPPDESAESGELPHENAEQRVARLAFQKAENVAHKTESGLILACDTLAECDGIIMGKPRDRQHAEQMLKTMEGRLHQVYSGVCLWRRPGDWRRIETAVSTLRMKQIPPEQLQAHLDSGDWEGKAGAFGFQQGYEWLELVEGTVSNVVGLPMDLLAEMLESSSL